MNNILKDFEKIKEHAHFWNWLPDWEVLSKIYEKFPESYSVLTPFAYSYLEELIRSTTPDYSIGVYDGNEKFRYKTVGLKLIKLAIKENKSDANYIKLLETAKNYFKPSDPVQGGGNRNNVGHGYIHSRFWEKEDFEKLIHFIATISKFSKF